MSEIGSSCVIGNNNALHKTKAGDNVSIAENCVFNDIEISNDCII